MTVDPDRILRMTRRFDAAPERVFDAWLDPQMASKWLFTSPESEKYEAQIDARIGGRYTITDRRGGKEYTGVGEYLEIDRPRRSDSVRMIAQTLLVYDDLGHTFTETPKSSSIRRAVRRADISAVGMPVPGCVLAPTKYRLW